MVAWLRGTLPVLLGRLLCGSAAAALQDSLDLEHSLLQASEEIHRSFKKERDVDVLHAVVSGSSRCASYTRYQVVARKHYEKSWTTIEASGYVDSTYNGSCFVAVVGACRSYSSCSDGSRRFPESLEGLEGVRWARRQAEVQGWHREEADLVGQLQSEPQKSSERALHLADSLRAAGLYLSESLQQAADSLLHVAAARAEVFRLSVTPGTAVAPEHGAEHLPPSAADLAQSIFALIDAARSDPCGESNDLPSLREAVVSQMGLQDELIEGVDIGSVLDPASFDYLQRAVEALVVGASLSLQASVLAAFTLFECDLLAQPEEAELQSSEAVAAAARDLLHDLRAAVPGPADMESASAPIQLCYANRLQDVHSVFQALSSPGAVAMDIPPLLTADHCDRLFAGIVNEVIHVVPYLNAAPKPEPPDYAHTTGEVRRILDASPHSSDASAFVFPYANIVERAVADSTAFVHGDKVLQLARFDDDIVNREASYDPDSMCSWATWVAWKSEAPLHCQYEIATLVCPEPGSPEGGHWVECSEEESSFLVMGWADLPDCPYLCLNMDLYASDNSCIDVGIGSYSPLCSNLSLPCSRSARVPEQAFAQLTEYTSRGHGQANGCGMLLVVPFTVVQPQPVEWEVGTAMPPFTVETWVRIAVDDLPDPHDDGPGLAVLVGGFPNWFLALRPAGVGYVQLGFYHVGLTRATYGRQESVLYSGAISWLDTWRHIAVVVTDEGQALHDNIFFYVDGEMRTSTRLTFNHGATATGLTGEYEGMFHIGPPNAAIFPELIEPGRTEPYFNITGRHLFFNAQLDEVRVHKVALGALSLGWRLTEMRRSAACDVPVERLEGSACRPVPLLTAAHSSEDRTACDVGFEQCGASPGVCMPVCPPSMLRQADCTCDCVNGHFQAWRILALRLQGAGTAGSVHNVTVYDATGHVVAHLHTAQQLPVELSFQGPTDVSVVSIHRGGGTASSISLSVTSVAGRDIEIEAYSNFPLATNGDTVLHHRRAHKFYDDTAVCADCTGQLQISTLPRVDALSCDCMEGDGRNILGQCQALGAPLQPPSITPSEGWHPADTLVYLISNEQHNVDWPWLLEVHYEISTDGSMPPTPTCTGSRRYDGGGLELIWTRTETRLCAVQCHPMHYASEVVCVELHGNDVMRPPTCTVVEEQVEMVVDLVPEAVIHYQLGDFSPALYHAPVIVEEPGTHTLQMWATATGFDDSAVSTCTVTILGEARANVHLVWMGDPAPQIGGFIFSEDAFVVHRNTLTLRFSFQVASGTDVETRYTLDGDAPEDAWLLAPASGDTIEVYVPHLLQGSVDVNTVVTLRWRAKEPLFKWTETKSIRLFFLAVHAPPPVAQAVPTMPWRLGDNWASDSPGFQATMEQRHRVELRPPTKSSRLVFVVGDAPWLATDSVLLNANSVDAASLAIGDGLLPAFQSRYPPPGLRAEDAAGLCGSDGMAGVKQLCEYGGPFEVFGNTTITAYALHDGEWESERLTLVVPLELDPPRGSYDFQAPVLYASARVGVNSLPNAFVLPTAVEALEFSLGLEGQQRQSCILTTAMSLVEIEGRGDPALSPVQRCADEGLWVPYNGMRQVTMTDLVSRLGDAHADENFCVNITVLSTVKRQGHLWAYPLAESFLWLTERAPQAAITTVLAPGAVPTPAAMVWLQSLHDGEPWQGHCYFAVAREPVEWTAPNWLMSVPDASTQVAMVSDAMRPGEPVDSAVPVWSWESDASVCSWPHLCSLPMEGTLPQHLVTMPDGLPWLCVWVVQEGYGESSSTCSRVEPGDVEEVEPSLTAASVEGSASSSGSSGIGSSSSSSSSSTVVVEVGRDESFDAEVVQLVESDIEARRLSTTGLPIHLPRDVPLQYRHASLSMGIEDMLSNTSHTVAALLVFTEWLYLGMDDPPPVVPLPPSGQHWPAEHVFIAVDVRALAGIDQWVDQGRSHFIVLTGRHAALHATVEGRDVLMWNSRAPPADAELLFWWAASGPEEPVPHTNVDDLVVVRKGFISVHAAYALGPGVHATSMAPGGASSELCAASEADDSLKFCRTPLPAQGVQLSAPSAGRWVLWATAYSGGLDSSHLVSVVMEASCPLPEDVPLALTPLCDESGAAYLLSGQTCVPQCQEGYEPSVGLLQCADGALSPQTLQCLEAPCLAPESPSNSEAPPCGPDGRIDSGASCSPACHEGYFAEPATMTCSKGSLWPANFTCLELGCDAPSDVLNSVMGSCNGSNHVQSGEECAVKCQAGYVPVPAALSCQRGVLEPATFDCFPAGCPAPIGILGAADRACAEGSLFENGAICTPQCADGFAPTETALACEYGAWRPLAFVCEEATLLGVAMSALMVLPGVVVVLSALGILVYLLKRRFFCRGKAAEPDVVSEWLTCLQSVEPQSCVFCGVRPQTCTGYEHHDWHSAFGSCDECVNVLIRGGFLASQQNDAELDWLDILKEEEDKDPTCCKFCGLAPATCSHHEASGGWKAEFVCCEGCSAALGFRAECWTSEQDEPENNPKAQFKDDTLPSFQPAPALVPVPKNPGVEFADETMPSFQSAAARGRPRLKDDSTLPIEDDEYESTMRVGAGRRTGRSARRSPRRRLPSPAEQQSAANTSIY